ncbi:hypothetical protein E2562_029423 [Oryza meyeriana var. granulata]|uniref:DUF834 domain-containing protein n=1 Tax=Oryza meyeriana var. granulata TaxID=110450 RepID=A0A6G1DPT6_9ORYZ|nr:hypothetical protein E2562_029423 [Oryza meyeriana var. granulata]
MTPGTGVEKMGTASRLDLRAHRRQTRATTGDEDDGNSAARTESGTGLRERKSSRGQHWARNADDEERREEEKRALSGEARAKPGGDDFGQGAEEGRRTGQPEEQAEAAVKMAMMTHVDMAALAVGHERRRRSMALGWRYRRRRGTARSGEGQSPDP